MADQTNRPLTEAELQAMFAAQDAAQESSVANMENAARDLGRAAGAAAAADGLNEGMGLGSLLDEATSTADRSGPLSGEWADDATPTSLLRELGLDAHAEESFRPGSTDSICDAYESGWFDGWNMEAVRQAREWAGPAAETVVVSEDDARFLMELLDEGLSGERVDRVRDVAARLHVAIFGDDPNEDEDDRCWASFTTGGSDPYGTSCDLPAGHGPGPHSGPDPMGGPGRVSWIGGGSCAGDPLPYRSVEWSDDVA